MEHAHQRTVRAELQSHIYIVFILEAVDKPNYVGMVQRLVDLNLCIELDSCSALKINLRRVDAYLSFGLLGLERTLRHYFARKLVIAGISDLIHSGEPALKGGWVNCGEQAGKMTHLAKEGHSLISQGARLILDNGRWRRRLDLCILTRKRWRHLLLIVSWLWRSFWGYLFVDSI
jgi:hypothetical protein